MDIILLEMMLSTYLGKKRVSPQMSRYNYGVATDCNLCGMYIHTHLGKISSGVDISEEGWPH